MREIYFLRVLVTFLVTLKNESPQTRINTGFAKPPSFRSPSRALVIKTEVLSLSVLPLFCFLGHLSPFESVHVSKGNQYHLIGFFLTVIVQYVSVGGLYIRVTEIVSNDFNGNSIVEHF